MNGRARITYGNQSAIRNQPASARLSEVLQRAAEQAGIDEVYIYSGGQPSAGKNRTGSHRHDNGNAADLRLMAGGRVLNFESPTDRPLIEAFVTAAHGLGATGIGAGVDYMGPTSLHVGFGPSSVWGAGGKSANAPDWLISSYNAAPGQSLAASAATSLASGGPIAQAPQNRAPFRDVPVPGSNPMPGFMRDPPQGPLGATNPSLSGPAGNPFPMVPPPNQPTAQDIITAAMAPAPRAPKMPEAAMPYFGTGSPAASSPPVPAPKPGGPRWPGNDPYQGPGPVKGPYKIIDDYMNASMFQIPEPSRRLAAALMGR